VALARHAFLLIRRRELRALAPALLALSVFLPWYSVTITASGAAYAQQSLNSVAEQYGNATLQDTANTVGAQFTALAGHQLGRTIAHFIDFIPKINTDLLTGICFTLIAILMAFGVTLPLSYG